VEPNNKETALATITILIMQQKLIELRLIDFKDRLEILKINYPINNRELDN
jgi:hypothetical protein